MVRKHCALAVAAISVAGAASAARAALLVEEPFGYGPGVNVISNATAVDAGSYGMQTSYYQVIQTIGTATTVTGPLTSPVPDGPASGDALDVITNGSSGLGVYNTFNSSVTAALPTDANTSVGSPKSIYISYVVDYLTLATGSSGSISNVQLLLSNTTSSSLNLGVNAEKNPGSTTYFGMNINAAGVNYGFTEATTGAAVATLTPTLVVIELDYRGGAGQDSLEMYINPTSTSSPVNQGYSGLTIPAVTGYEFATSGTTTVGGTSTEYDEFRVGTTFADILTPEPATISAFAVSAIGLLMRRRRSTQ